MDLTSVVSVDVNVFFFWSKKGSRQVRVIARAGASAHIKLTLGTSLEFHVFFSIHRYTNTSGAFLNLFHYIFPMNIQKDCLAFFFMPHSYFWNNECKKKNSKLEREDYSNANPLLHHGFFFPFTRIFLQTFRMILYHFGFCRVSISRKMNAKKLEIRGGRQEQWIL